MQWPRGARGAAEAIEDGSDLVGMQARSRALGMEHLLPPRLGLGAATMPHPGTTLRAQSVPRGLCGGARSPFRGRATQDAEGAYLSVLFLREADCDA